MIKIMKSSECPESEILSRSGGGMADVSDTVAGIIADVRARGDEALREYSLRFDRADLKSLEVPEAEIDEAMACVGPELIEALEKAAANIRAYHENQRRTGFVVNERPGVMLGQKVLPIERAGLYIPGGTAAYPSTLLMNCIPAKIAGVSEIIVTSPATGGHISPVILAAARIAGADRVFGIGGAQAVAALAYGTESVPRVDKIVGPGNAFVAEAKRQVFGAVAIDIIAGPSEILVVADAKSDPDVVAADMLSQAEHDKNATAVLVTDSVSLAEAVSERLEARIPAMPRREIARASIDNNGKIIVVGSIGDAIDISNRLAPEHLELCLDSPFDVLDRVKNAGSVFLGRSCPEALGDYFAGPNHTLPTSGTARFSSPLSVDDFVKKMQFTYYTPSALEDAAPYVERLAEAEGLFGHAESVRSRFGGGVK